MRCRNSAKAAKEYYDDNIERYYQERNEAFMNYITEIAQQYIEEHNTEDNKTISIIGFAEQIDEDSLDFPNDT